MEQTANLAGALVLAVALVAVVRSVQHKQPLPVINTAESATDFITVDIPPEHLRGVK